MDVESGDVETGGFCHPTNEDPKRGLELFESVFFFFFRLIRDDCLRNLKNPCEAAKITIRVLKILDQFWKMNFRRIFSQNSQIVFQ